MAEEVPSKLSAATWGPAAWSLSPPICTLCFQALSGVLTAERGKEQDRGCLSW